ncbi:MAG TPA: hypothetical protein PK400_06355 [Phycisphaerales bacterium]|nr:hypothetical protein [Phycisphaerales bacterium]HRQ74778.1 hypothetical protein [Phycisphaerales bacterium]
MFFSNRTQRVRFGTPVSCSAIALVTAVAAGPAALAGEIKGGPGANHWDGSVNQSWQVAGNWSTNQVPGAGASAIVVGGPLYNVFLHGNTANLNSLFLGALQTISTNGHRLEVMSGERRTTVTGGVDSVLYVNPRIGGGWGFRTNELSVQSNARLGMSGGHARIHDQLTLLTGGQITGYGLVEVISPKPAAFNGLAGGPLTVSGGDLRIVVSNGGSMVLPNVVNVTQAGRTLELDGPLFLPMGNLNLGNECTVDFGNTTTINGTLSASPGAANSSYIVGSVVNVNGDAAVQNGGRLVFESPVFFGSGGTTSIYANATMEFQNVHDAASGHLMTIANGARVLMKVGQFLTMWSGDIQVSAGGIIDLDGPFASWAHNGNLTLAGFANRSRIQGNAAFRAYGDVRVTGTGAVVDGAMELMPSGTLEIVHPTGELIVNGTFRVQHMATIFGSGRLEIGSTGRAFAAEPVYFDVGVLNGGTFEIGLNESEVGLLNILGNYTQQGSGRLAMDIASNAPQGADYFSLTGAATLAGELNIELLNGFVPAIGDMYTVLWASNGISGTFDSVTGAPGFSVTYEPHHVRITYVGVPVCPTDLNGDGATDVSDLIILLAAWGTCGGCNADINGDGSVDVQDLLILLANWGGCA